MSSESILIVEDDAILAMFLADMLVNLHYAVFPPISTGEEAVSFALQNRPTLVLMDIQLAGEMDGITAAREIVEKTGIPIVFLTSFGQPRVVEKAKTVAPYGYLVKPVAERDLAATLETAIYKHQVDQHLRESESRFRQVADSAPVLIWMSGTDKLCNFFNEPWLRFTGRTAEQEMGARWAEGVHPEDLQRCLDIYTRSFEARTEFKIEYRLRHASGEYRWILDNGVARFTPDGEFLGYIGTCIDIHERKQADDKLRASEEQYRRLLNTLPSGVVIHTDGKIVFANEVSVRLVGAADAAELIGMKMLDRVHPDYRDLVTGRVNITTQDLNVAPAVEEKLLRMDGSAFDAEVIAMPTQYAGKPASLVVINDISSRKLAETALNRRADELSALQATVLDISSPRSLPELLNLIVERAANLVNATSGGLYLAEPEFSRVRCLVSYKTRGDFTGVTLDYGSGAAGQVAATGQPLIIDNYAQWQNRATAFEKDQPFTSVMSAPMTWRGQVTGVLHVLREDTSQKFTRDELKLLVLLANHAAVAVENRRLYQAIDQELEQRKQAEEKLVQSEAHYRLLAENISDVIWVMDLETMRLRYISPSVQTLRGYTVDEVLAETLEHFATPESVRSIQAAIPGRLQAAIQDGDAYYIDNIEQACKDGTTVWTETTTHCVFNAITSHWEIYGVSRDITERNRAEAAISSLALRNQTLLNTSTDGIHVLDENGSIVEANPAFYRMLGYAPDEMTGMHVADWDAQWTQPELLAKIQQLIATPQLFETRHSRKDGSIIDVELNAVGVKLDGHNFLYVAGRDITSRKQAERALVASETRLRAILESSTDAIGVHINGIWNLCNPAAVRMFGMDSEEDLLGKSILGVIAPTEHERIRGFVRHRLEDNNAPNSYITRGVRKNGQEFDLDVTISIFDLENSRHVMVILRDISQQLRAERTLRESEETFRAIINTSPDAVGLFDAYTNIQVMNPAAAAVFGFASSEEMIGRSALDFFLPEERDMASQVIGQVLITGLVRNASFRLLRKDGTSFQAEFSCSALYDPSGNPRGIIAVTRDVTERKSMEEALRAAEADYRAIFENAPIGIFRSTPQGAFKKVNNAMARIFGYAAPQEMLTSITSISSQVYVHAQDRKEFQRILVADGQVLNFDGLNYRKDHSLMWTKTDARVIKDGRGNIQFYEGFITDISGRKHSDEALKESETRYRLLFENMDEGFALQEVITDEFGNGIDFRFIDANAAYENHTGMKPSDIIGKTMHEVLPQADQRMVEKFCRVGLTGEPTAFEYFSDTFQRHLQVRVFSPQPGRFATVFEDITERRLAEETERARARQYHDMFESNTAIKLLVDPDNGAIVEANHAAVVFYGWPVAALQGMNINQVDTADQDLLSQSLLQAARQERSFFISRHNLASGEIRDVEIHSGPIESGSRKLLFTIIHDISDRKKAESELAKAMNELEQRVRERTADLQSSNTALEKALHTRDEFMAMMSHELRTPLTGILGMAQLLQYKTYGELNEKQVGALQTIERSGQSLHNLIDAILDLTRLQSGGLDLHFTACSLPMICSANLQALRDQVAKKQQTLDFSMTPHNIMIQADERRLYQMIDNLLNNASKFTPQGGHIQLDVTGMVEQRQVRISVKDTGIGIREEDQEQIFQPFVQLDGRLARKFNGSGLGLAMVKLLVELHGGRVQVESAPEHGSCFTLILPWKN